MIRSNVEPGKKSRGERKRDRKEKQRGIWGKKYALKLQNQICSLLVLHLSLSIELNNPNILRKLKRLIILIENKLLVNFLN